MTRKTIFESVEIIFRDVLENNELVIDESYTAHDVDGWDSLTQIMLVVEIEKKLNITFLSSEVTTWKDIGEMIDCIESKIND